MGFTTEASQRFERGADPDGVIHAINLAAALMQKYAGGTVAKGIVDEYPQQIENRTVVLEPEKINRLLGTDLSKNTMVELLSKTEISMEGDTAIIPTFRPDLAMSADLAEEVGRLYGYDNIPTATHYSSPYNKLSNPFDDFLERIRDILTGAGIQEVFTNSMVNRESWEKITQDKIYPILNPISADLNGMRNSLIPSLLEVLEWNSNRQQKDLAIFEINSIFPHPEDLNKTPKEALNLSIAFTGKVAKEDWHSDRRAYDFYDIKGIFSYLADKISLDKFQFRAYDNFAIEGQSLEITLKNQAIGYLGKVKPSLQKQYDIDTAIFVANIDLKAVYKAIHTEKKYTDIPKFPIVERDFAIVVNTDVTAADLSQAIERSAGKHFKELSVFDIYTGKQIDANKKSLAFRLHFQSTEKTLTEKEINKATNKILNTLKRSFDAELRS